MKHCSVLAIFLQADSTYRSIHTYTQIHKVKHTYRHPTVSALPETHSLAGPEAVWFCRKPHVGGEQNHGTQEGCI